RFCDAALNGSLSARVNIKKVSLAVGDSSKYLYRHKGYYTDWIKKNTYCYSLTVPLSTPSDEVDDIIRKDMSHWLEIALGITMRKERKLIPCLILTRQNRTDSLWTVTDTSRQISAETTPSIFKIENGSFSNLQWELNENCPGLPWVVDETGINRRSKAWIS